MKMYGPFKLEAKIHFTDGEKHAITTCTLGNGTTPTVEQLSELIVKAEVKIKKEFGEDWRLCTKREFFDVAMFTMPGGEEWDRD